MRFVLPLSCLLAVLLGGCICKRATVDTGFRLLDEGAALQHAKRENIVFNDKLTWERFWADNCQAMDEKGEKLPAPLVDFEQNTMVGVFAGQKPTGGYALDLVSVRKTRTGIEIAVTEHAPPRDAMVIQVLTFPYRLVILEKTTLPVRVVCR